jgi:hypothetical protein
MKPYKYQIMLGSGVLEVWYLSQPVMREIPLAEVDTVKLMRHLNNSSDWFLSHASNSVLIFQRINVEA